LKNDANLNLGALGERFHLNEKAVSGVLKTFGFLNRKRTNSGWVVLIDRAARKRVHELLSLYGVESPAACLPSQAPGELCEFCQPQDPTDPEPPLIKDAAKEISTEPGAPADLASTLREHGEHGERREHENEGEEGLGSSKFIETPEDEATFNAIQKTIRKGDPEELP
jgi:ribosomal protein L34